MEEFKPVVKNKEDTASKEEVRYKGKIFEVISEPVEIDGKTFNFEKVASATSPVLRVLRVL